MPRPAVVEGIAASQIGVDTDVPRTPGSPSSGFDDNVVDSIMLFHREGAAWKLWSDDVIGVAFEPKAGAGTPSTPTTR